MNHLAKCILVGSCIGWLCGTFDLDFDQVFCVMVVYVVTFQLGFDKQKEIN